MAQRVCPWWIGYLLACPLRRWAHDPAKILAPYVRDGMTVLEPGPGMGFFTLPMARMVGATGRVVAVDIQPRMLDALRRRAGRTGLGERIETRLAQTDSLGLDHLAGQVDFALAFAVVHEMASAASFFSEVVRTLKPGGQMLLAEPAGHVRAPQFEAELRAAEEAGLQLVDRSSIRRSHAALFKKP
jgi:ubiquinone/menaquinone biosynthesis C-methylase UbiE